MLVELNKREIALIRELMEEKLDDELLDRSTTAVIGDIQVELDRVEEDE